MIIEVQETVYSNRNRLTRNYRRNTLTKVFTGQNTKGEKKKRGSKWSKMLVCHVKGKYENNSWQQTCSFGPTCLDAMLFSCNQVRLLAFLTSNFWKTNDYINSTYTWHCENRHNRDQSTSIRDLHVFHCSINLIHLVQ